MDDAIIAHDHIRATTVKARMASTPKASMSAMSTISCSTSATAGVSMWSCPSAASSASASATIRCPGRAYDPERGGYVVNVSRRQLGGAPTYRPGEEPDWNDRRCNGSPVI